MIYLHTHNNTNDLLSAKFCIQEKILKIEVFNKKTEEVLKVEKDITNDKYNTFILAIGEKGLELIEAFRYTYSYRGKFERLQELLNTNMLATIKLGKIRNTDFDMLIELGTLSRSNIEIETTMTIKEEELKLNEEKQFEKNKRLMLFPSYSLATNNIEYMSDDVGNMISETNIIEYSGEYVDIEIKKYDLEFKNHQNENDDNEKIYIESTCGLLNATMLCLENGKNVVRLYPFGYEGIFTIKIGWRWYRVRNQYDLVLKKIETI